MSFMAAWHSCSVDTVTYVVIVGSLRWSSSSNEPRVYRSGFPVAETFPFLARLGVRTVINFQDRLPLDYKAFLAEQRVQYIHAPVKGNKVHPEEMDWGRVSAALALVSDTAFHPILVHCA